MAQIYTSIDFSKRFSVKNTEFTGFFRKSGIFHSNFRTLQFKICIQNKVMKKSPAILTLLFAASVFMVSTTSCNRGTGCPMNENAHVQPNKKGEYPKTKTRSGLFPKGVYKRGN